MDIYCQRCDESWTVSYVCHEMDDEYDGEYDGLVSPSERFKCGDGCPACKWGKDAPEQQSFRSVVMSSMLELLGDDLCGAASMMDDFQYMGLLEE